MKTLIETRQAVVDAFSVVIDLTKKDEGETDFGYVRRAASSFYVLGELRQLAVNTGYLYESHVKSLSKTLLLQKLMMAFHWDKDGNMLSESEVILKNC